MQTFCGVDVSKDWLDAWMEAAGHRRFANTLAGIIELAGFAREHGAELIVMEASGGIEQPAYLELWHQGCPCAVANANAVRHYAKAIGYLEKTDRIDAQVIARFAGAKQLRPMAPPSPAQQHLTALGTRLRQATSDLVIQKQRLHSTRDEQARASLLEAIAFFKRQIQALAAQISDLIESDPMWQALDRSWRSIKGVADRSVTMLLAQLPEIGLVSNRAIAKLAGLGPLADDSGKRSGKRSIRGGRAEVRSLLFLIGGIAAKFDPSLAAFRDRLTQKGKCKMVVRVALARKLLVRLNAKARDARVQLVLAA